MARKSRIEFDGALYRVIVRGNQTQEVFRSKEYSLDPVKNVVELNKNRKET